MKTPAQMLIDIASEMTDAAITLELIYKSTDNGCEIDSGISCVIRSLLNTNEKAQGYIEILSDVPASTSLQEEKSGNDIADDIFHATITARKLEELAHIYNEFYFTDKDNGSPEMYMADVIFDYARKVRDELVNIEKKLN